MLWGLTLSSMETQYHSAFVPSWTKKLLQPCKLDRALFLIVSINYKSCTESYFQRCGNQWNA